jgi:peptidoglycan/LPS O-acetylase OafA/YrhL
MSQLVEVKKHAYIDALRGIAVLGTLLIHCSKYEKGINDFGDIFKDFFQLGNSGVQLFFMMSAFTLYMSMSQKKGLEKNTYFNFFVRRIFRILPLFYFSVIIYFFIQNGNYWWLKYPNIDSFSLIISTLTFTNGFHPIWINSIVEGGWSIAIEMIFYALFPLIFKYIKSLKRAMFFLIISLFISSLSYLIMIKYPLIEQDGLWKGFYYFNFLAQLPIFILGILIYLIINQKGRFTEWINDIQIPIILFAFYLISNLLFSHIQNHVLIAFSMFIVVLTFTSKENKLFINKVTCFLGKISYSMYLTHFPVLFIMWKLNLIDVFKGQILNFGLRFFILIVLTSLFSYITYRLIELPGVNLGKKIIVYFENKRK